MEFNEFEKRIITNLKSCFSSKLKLQILNTIRTLNKIKKYVELRNLDFKDLPQTPQRGIFLTCLKDKSDISYHICVELRIKHKGRKYLMIFLLAFLSGLKVKL